MAIIPKQIGGLLSFTHLTTRWLRHNLTMAVASVTKTLWMLSLFLVYQMS